MDKRRRKQAKTSTRSSEASTIVSLLRDIYALLFYAMLGVAEVSSLEWDFINMSEQEEDLIFRMYKLVGDRWGLIAGRIPGRKAEEIERFWIMKHEKVYASRRKRAQYM